MSFDDWMLALHVLSAFTLVAGLILFWVLIVAVRRTDTPDGTLRMGPLTRVADAAVGVYRLREGKGAGLLKATLVLSLVLLAAYVVAVWAMAGKPN